MPTRLRVTILKSPAHGTFEKRSETSWLYTPKRSFVGSDKFTWSASDGEGGSRTAAGFVSVHGDTSPPGIKSVAANGPNNRIVVALSEPVITDGAESIENFALSPETKITGVDLADDAVTFTLKTAPLVRRTIYTLTVRKLKDRSIRGNAANSTAKFQYAPFVGRAASTISTGADEDCEVTK